MKDKPVRRKPWPVVTFCVKVPDPFRQTLSNSILVCVKARPTIEYHLIVLALAFLFELQQKSFGLTPLEKEYLYFSAFTFFVHILLRMEFLFAFFVFETVSLIKDWYIRFYNNIFVLIFISSYRLQIFRLQTDTEL